MRNYELSRNEKGFYDLYFFDEEFKVWEYIKSYNAKDTTIKEIYDFVKLNNKLNQKIKITFIF